MMQQRDETTHPIGSLDDQLRVAASNGLLEKIHSLLQEGAGFQADRDGRTALHHAAFNGYADVCQLLIERGFDYDHQDSNGYTALQRAVSQGHTDVVSVLVVAGCGLDTQDHVHGNAAIHEASWNGFSKTLEVLAKHNANVFIINKAGFNALHLVAQNGHNESSRVLLYAGCNPDMKNNYGDTALHTAARYGHAGVSRILLSSHCKVNEQNKNGDTALHIAAALRRRKITKVLVDGCALITITNKQGETAVDVAQRKDHHDIISIILSQPQNDFKSPVLYRSSKEDLDLIVDDPTTKPQTPDKKKKKFFFRRKKSKEKEKEKCEGGGFVDRRAGNHVSGFFSRYIHEDGFMYYKDLAGNIKQGPVGYTPVCQCAPRLHKLEKKVEGDKKNLVNRVDSSHQVLQDHIEHIGWRTNQQVKSVSSLAKKRLDAEHEKCTERIKKHLDEERQETVKRLSVHDASIRGDIQAWVETRISDYSRTQGRVNDDSGLYNRRIFHDVGDPYGGRLYRTRSDETLSQSDYSVRNKKKRLFESQLNPGLPDNLPKVSGRRKDREVSVGQGGEHHGHDPAPQLRVSDQPAMSSGGGQKPSRTITSTPNERKAETHEVNKCAGSLAFTGVSARGWDTTNGQSYVRLQPGPVTSIPGLSSVVGGGADTNTGERVDDQFHSVDALSRGLDPSARRSADISHSKAPEGCSNVGVSANGPQTNGPPQSGHSHVYVRRQPLEVRNYGDYAQMPRTELRETNAKPTNYAQHSNLYPQKPTIHSPASNGIPTPYRSQPDRNVTHLSHNNINQNFAIKTRHEAHNSDQTMNHLDQRPQIRSHTPDLRSVGRGRTTDRATARTRPTTSASPAGYQSSFVHQPPKANNQTSSYRNNSIHVSPQSHNVPANGINHGYNHSNSNLHANYYGGLNNRLSVANRPHTSVKSAPNTNHVRFMDSKTAVDPVSCKPYQSARNIFHPGLSVGFRNDSPSREVMAVLSKSEPFIAHELDLSKTRPLARHPLHQNKEDSGSNRSNPDSGYSSRLYGNAHGYRDMSPRMSDLSTGTPSSSFSLEHNATPVHFNAGVAPLFHYPPNNDKNNNETAELNGVHKNVECNTQSHGSTSSSSKQSYSTTLTNPTCQRQFSVTKIDPMTNLRGTDV